MFQMRKLLQRSFALTLFVLSLVLAIVVNSGLLSSSVASGAQTVPEERSGLAPLSRTEIERVRKGANGTDKVAQRPQAARPIEELMIELLPPEKGAPVRANAARQAEVLYYDYQDDTALRVIVDVRSGKVQKTEAVAGMQPLISASEERRALVLALGDAQVGSVIRTQYKALTGVELTSPDQLLVDAGVFSWDSLPEVPAVQKCAKKHRCTGLLLSTADGRLINAHPVIDLSNDKALYVIK